MNAGLTFDSTMDLLLFVAIAFHLFMARFFPACLPKPLPQLEGEAGQLVAKTGVLRTVSSGDGSQWKECYNEKTGDRSKPTLKKTHLPVLLHHRKCTPHISSWLT